MQLNQHNIFWALLTNQKTKNECNHSKYLQWENETEELTLNLVKRGSFDSTIKTWECDQYWGIDAPIKFSQYPYHSCEIHQCSICNEFFFHYIENGGHYSQNRFRIIDIKLIDKRDFQPNTKTIIDMNGYEYSVYKLANNKLELSVCRTDIALGINISKVLSNIETENYYKDGVQQLTNLMNNMRENFEKYQVTSWR